jgi:hypothetical protein
MKRNLCEDVRYVANRRDFLRHTSAGFGYTALAALAAGWSKSAVAAETAAKRTDPLAPKPPHFAARAKRVIFLFMSGGPSHLETFDWKPELAKAGPGGPGGKLLAPVFQFAPSGKSGLMISEIFPELAKQADKMCILNGMTTKNPGHQQAIVALHTGNEMFVRPSVGAWVTYGLGSEAEDLPGFVTINPISDQGGAMNYGSAFLPATFQGTRLDGGSSAVPNIANHRLTDADQRRQIDFIQRANRRMLAADAGHPELEGLIGSYELAYKMQTSVPAALDIDDEPEHIRRLYGLDDGATSHFAQQCLMARRLAEKGVRFIQLTRIGWDQHNNLREAMTRNAESIDRPMAALLQDLDQRGMLDDTLVVWGGEFGRTPNDDKGDGNGRGHNAKGYSMWMAGGGVKRGFAYGATDPTGREAVEGVIGTHDLHATMLHLLGLDHEALTFKYAGRDFRLTDVHGVVAKDIIA